MNISKLCQTLKEYKVDYALVGGHAVALHGAVRGTVDYDFILNWELKNLERAEKALLFLGLQSQHPVTAKDIFNFRDEYIKNKNMIAWNFIHPKNPLIQVDIIINFNLKDRTTNKTKYKNSTIVYLGIDDLIEMKTLAGREQDLFDIDALKRIKNEN